MWSRQSCFNVFLSVSCSSFILILDARFADLLKIPFIRQKSGMMNISLGFPLKTRLIYPVFDRDEHQVSTHWTTKFLCDFHHDNLQFVTMSPYQTAPYATFYASKPVIIVMLNFFQPASKGFKFWSAPQLNPNLCLHPIPRLQNVIWTLLLPPILIGRREEEDVYASGEAQYKRIR